MRFEGRARVRAQLDVAPLVDVVFLLLIFFLLTSTYIKPRAIGVSLPTSSTAQASIAPVVTVVLRADGSIEVDGASLSISQLADAVASRIGQDRERTVVLEADRTARVQEMIEVVDAIRAGGAAELAISALQDPRHQAR